MEQDLIIVAEFESQEEADEAKLILEAAGIESIISDCDADDVARQNSAFGGVVVLVHTADEERAIKVLEEGYLPTDQDLHWQASDEVTIGLPADKALDIARNTLATTGKVKSGYIDSPSIEGGMRYSLGYVEVRMRVRPLSNLGMSVITISTRRDYDVRGIAAAKCLNMLKDKLVELCKACGIEVVVSNE